MKLVFGLGNPGKEYEKTIHNAGFLALDAMAESLSFGPFRRHRGAYACEGYLGGERIMLIKPQTYMNLSGKCVLEFAAFYKVASTDIVVLYDDVDLDLGAVRIRQKGSAGTHNGMKSIISTISTEEFFRVRIGVGRPPQGWDLVHYVLSALQGEAGKAFCETTKKAADAAICLIEDGIELAQRRYNNKGHLKKEEQGETIHES